MRTFVGVVCGLAAAAARAQATDVQVVNSADQPVPVVAKGTVGVTNAPTGPLAVTIDSGQPVTTMPLSDQSQVTVLGLCNFFNSPATTFIQCSYGQMLGTIPAGYRFIIDSVSVVVGNMPTGVQPAAYLEYGVSTHTLSGTATFPVPLASTPGLGGTHFFGGNIVGLHAAAGPGLTLSVNFSKAIPSATAQQTGTTMVGHFVAVIPELQAPNPQP